MVKLSDKEIEKALNADVIEIPYDARSKFTFKIEENIEDLVKQLNPAPKYAPEERHIDAKTGEVFFTGGRKHKVREPDEFYSDAKIDAETGNIHYTVDDSDFRGDDISGKPWELGRAWGHENRELHGDFKLWDTDFDCYASVWVEKDKMKISTAWSGFKYEISQNKDGTSTVEFSGPLNGLMAQELLPKMTYISGTLEGKFIDDRGDLTPYMDIEDYCVLRDQKNQGRKNEQDYYGHWINRMFNNEISAFPKFNDLGLVHNEQEHKNVNAQVSFENGDKLSKYHIKDKVDFMRKRLAKSQEMTAEIREGIKEATPIKKVAENAPFNATPKTRGGMGE